MDNRIYLTLGEQFGNTTIIPRCEQAERLAKLSGTKLLTMSAVRIAHEMGFEIYYKPNLKDFNPVRIKSLDSLEDLLQ